MTDVFNSNVVERLNEPIDPGRVKTRRAPGGRTVSYIEGHDAIATANIIFGYGNWGYRVEDINRDGRLVYATVTVTVAGGIPFTDVGVSIARAREGEEPSYEAIETAIKGAVTDGVKRALKNYGPQFGLSLYNRNDSNDAQQVEVPEASEEATERARRYTITFGKHQGRTLDDLVDGDERDHRYLRWLAGLVDFNGRYFEARGEANAKLQKAARYLCTYLLG